MEIVAIIPARSGSKGIVNKNLQEVGGKKLIEWSIGASLRTKSINRTIVSTDSIEYAQLCKNAGAEVPFLRPENLSSDFSPDSEFILHAINQISSDGTKPDFLVHLRPTTPFRDPEVIERAISQYVATSSEFSALRSVHEMSESAYKTFEIDESSHLVQTFTKNRDIEKSNNARQSFPTTFSPNGYVDVINCEHVLKTGKLHGDSVNAFITERVVEVDDLQDLEFLNSDLLRSNRPFNRIFG